MEEKIDVLDENGAKTGEVVTKEQVHEDGKWHAAVHVWFFNQKGELLVQRRSKTKINNPDMLDISAAGHVSSGETSLQAAIRETKEELGIDIDKDELNKIGRVKVKRVLNDGTYFNNEINDIYFVKSYVEISQMTRQIEEVDEIKYVSWKEFKVMVENKQEDVVAHDEEYDILFKYIEKIL